MGGFGSGLWQHGKKITDDILALDVRRLHRDGLLIPKRWVLLKWSRNGKEVGSVRMETHVDYLIFLYRSRSHGGDWQQQKQSIALEWTNCHLGGQRIWFRCPIAGCARRVAILYVDPVFACRQCHNLAYRCQRETDDDRAARRADAIRHRLGWQPGFLNGKGSKPKGMHWQTFWRLESTHDGFVRAAMDCIAQRLDLPISYPTEQKRK